MNPEYPGDMAQRLNVRTPEEQTKRLTKTAMTASKPLPTLDQLYAEPVQEYQRDFKTARPLLSKSATAKEPLSAQLLHLQFSARNSLGDLPLTPSMSKQSLQNSKKGTK